MKLNVPFLFACSCCSYPALAAQLQTTSPLLSPMFFGPAGYAEYNSHDSVGIGLQRQEMIDQDDIVYRTQALGLFTIIKNRFNIALVPSGVFGSKRSADQADLSGAAAFSITEHLAYGLFSDHMKDHPNTTNSLVYHQESFEVGVSHTDSSQDSKDPAYVRMHGQWRLPNFSLGFAYDRYLMYAPAYHALTLAVQIPVRTTSTLQTSARMSDGKFDQLKFYWAEALSDSLFAGFSIEHNRGNRRWVTSVAFDIRKDLN